ncbi:MAG: hypothetical protein H6720_31030, partial [Sandaracinus sp.]|nr:hypothetical protein [Sandaracinus sp.]
MLDLVDSARRRPGMYVGGTDDGFGVAELLYEVVGNTLDQALIGEVRHLRIALRPNEAEVLDDGPGISTERLPSGRTFLEEVATVFHDSPTADGHAPHVHLRVGTDFGLALVTALCEEVEITTRGLTQRFGRGLVIGPADTIESTVGTRVRFALDPTIFPPQGWPVDDVADRLKVIAAHVPGLQVELIHEDTRGVTRWVLGPYVGPEALLDARGAEEATVICRAREATWQADVVLRSALRPKWSTIVSFANFARTPGHGVHVDGMQEGVAKALGQRASRKRWR